MGLTSLYIINIPLLVRVVKHFWENFLKNFLVADLLQKLAGCLQNVKSSRGAQAREAQKKRPGRYRPGQM